jgi:nucleoside 2-deoxyribosyltransferase
MGRARPNLKVYLASPLGFSPEMRPYLEKIKGRLRDLGCEVFDPWTERSFAGEIEQAYAIGGFLERSAAFARIAAGIGALNETAIREADILLGVLDGAELDAGTSSEIGFASALGKRCYGLRTDSRESGDFDGIPVNLQVLHFIERSGGRIFRRIDDLSLFP